MFLGVEIPSSKVIGISLRTAAIESLKICHGHVKTRYLRVRNCCLVVTCPEICDFAMYCIHRRHLIKTHR